MPELTIDYSEIILQENIPLNNDDITYIEEQRKGFRKIPVILAFCTLITMGMACWFIRDKFKSFLYYEYLLLVFATFALYIFCYFIGRLIIRYDSNNWLKDSRSRKSKLTSVIINRDKTEYGEYLTFAGKHKGDKIRIRVKEKDYKSFQIGAKIIVVYLKFSKEALQLIEL
jgi:hypothetical protein